MIHLAHGMVQWEAHVNTVMGLPQLAENLLTS
jgi:hypothetical protein